MSRDERMDQKKPKLTIVSGRKDKIVDRILEEVLKPKPIDRSKVDPMLDQLKPKGQLKSISCQAPAPGHES